MRDLAAQPAGARPDLPNAHQPKVSESKVTPLSKFSLWNVGEGDSGSGVLRKIRQPTTGVDFVEQRVRHRNDQCSRTNDHCMTNSVRQNRARSFSSFRRCSTL